MFCAAKRWLLGEKKDPADSKLSDSISELHIKLDFRWNAKQNECHEEVTMISTTLAISGEPAIIPTIEKVLHLVSTESCWCGSHLIQLVSSIKSRLSNLACGVWGRYYPIQNLYQHLGIKLLLESFKTFQNDVLSAASTEFFSWPMVPPRSRLIVYASELLCI